MSKEFVDLVKQEVKERLPNWLGQSHYICDLGFMLTKTENSNGSWFCSRYEAKEFSLFLQFHLEVPFCIHLNTPWLAVLYLL